MRPPYCGIAQCVNFAGKQRFLWFDLNSVCLDEEGRPILHSAAVE